MALPSDAGLYKVPKEKSLVLVKIPPMSPEWKTIFLSSCAESHVGQETVSDLFNAEKLFLPLLGEKEGIALVRRSAVRWLRIEEAEKNEWYYYEIREGAPRAKVRCGFGDGEVLEGMFYAIGRIEEQRVLDVVNRPESFLHLDTESGLFLVNLSHVTTVHVVEEDYGGPR